MRIRALSRVTSVMVIAAMLSSCGGGGGGSSGGGGSVTPTPTPVPTATPTPVPTPTPAACSLRARQDWVLAQLREWYLFPETLPTAPDPTPYTSLDSWTDALTATARGQGRDRFFTYVTSIAAEQAFYSSGESAGFGFRLATDSAGRRVFVSESFEGAPALDANVDRGAEILAIGDSVATLRSVSDIIAQQGAGGVTTALGEAAPGVVRVFRVSEGGTTRDISLTKRTYDVAPISSRTGVRVIDNGSGGRVGYVNLRTFISPADDALRNAFTRFKSEGVSDVIVDLRYNGGGLLSVARTFANLLGGARSTSDVQTRVTYRPEKSDRNETTMFAPQPESIAPRRIAFIGSGGTASASEAVINTFIPYLGANVALIGTNTFGKPVGQIAIDRNECDDRLRVVALSLRNRDNQGDYFSGLASRVQASCQAADDVLRPMGDPQEASTRAALDFIAGRSCTPISPSATALTASAQRGASGQRVQTLLTPERPSPAQREVPGLF